MRPRRSISTRSTCRPLSLATVLACAILAWGASARAAPQHGSPFDPNEAHIAGTIGWLASSDGRVPALAWLVIFGMLTAGAVFLVARRKVIALREHRTDILLFGGAVLVALALRFALPWGPMNFAEGDRLATAWNRHFSMLDGFESVPVLLAMTRALGLSPAGAFRFSGPLLGALGVGFAYLFARGARLGPPAALVAAALVAVWPAHARYSASGEFTPSSVTLWAAAFALALSRWPARWKLPLLAAVVVVGVYSRPECRLLVVPLVPLTLMPHWTWRDRGIFAVLLAAGLVPYVLAHGAPDSGIHYQSYTSSSFARFLARDVSVNPLWWMIAGVAGIFAGRLAWQVRVSLALSIVLLIAIYWFTATEHNPLWGEWRYLLSIVPYLAVGAAALVDRLAARFAPIALRPRVVTGVAAFTFLTGLAYLPVLTRPIDSQTEFAYVAETAAKIVADRPKIVVLTEGQREQIRFEEVPVMALASVFGPGEWPRDAGSTLSRRIPEIWSQSVLLDARAKGPDIGQIALYLGMYQPQAVVDKIKERYELVPLDERAVDVAPMLQYVNTQCPIQRDVVLGGALPDCHLQLGWYSLVPRGG